MHEGKSLHVTQGEYSVGGLQAVALYLYDSHGGERKLLAEAPGTTVGFRAILLQAAQAAHQYECAIRLDPTTAHTHSAERTLERKP